MKRRERLLPKVKVRRRRNLTMKNQRAAVIVETWMTLMLKSISRMLSEPKGSSRTSNMRIY